MGSTPHKRRKGFRRDAELLGEAYESVHDSSQQLNEIAPLLAAGLGYLGGAAVKGAAKGIYKGVTDPATPRGREEINVSTSDEVEDNELSDDWESREGEGENGDFGNRNLKYVLKDIFELSSDPGMEDASSDDWRQRLDDIVRDYSSYSSEDDDKYSREPSNIGLPGAQY